MSFWSKLFGHDRVAPHDPETTAHLITVSGNEELAAVEAMLRSAEIAYRICDRGAGSVVRVISGYTLYGTDVFVRPEDVEDAKALLAPVDAAEDEIAGDEGGHTEEKESE